MNRGNMAAAALLAAFLPPLQPTDDERFREWNERIDAAQKMKAPTIPTEPKPNRAQRRAQRRGRRY